MEKRFYAGIGSRKTPESLKPKIKLIVEFLESEGYILRSGGAGGADTFFEEFVKCGYNKEIYLPWKGFNNNQSSLYSLLNENTAINIAKRYHPKWGSLSSPARNLMARNTYQVMGKNLNHYSEFIVCYTLDGKISGGTGQAMRIAKDKGIPIFNLFYKSIDVSTIKNHISSKLII